MIFSTRSRSFPIAFCTLLFCGLQLQAGEADALARKIDALVQARLDQAKIPASAPADDAEFLRRVYLDITGRIPTYEQTIAFLSNKNADRRAKLIEELLNCSEYGLYFGNIWRELVIDRTPEMSMPRQYFSWDFRAWLAEGFNTDRGWNDMVAEMITHEGETKGKPSAGFLLSARMNGYPRPADMVSISGRLFMGIQIRCAQCHDHPFVDGWKQDDFWGMAAFFGQVRDHALRPGAMVPDNPRFSEAPLTDPKTEQGYNRGLMLAGTLPPLKGPEIAVPGAMDATKTMKVVKAKHFLDKAPDNLKDGNYRISFAQWLTAPENRYFARTSVNRLWSHFFARGIDAVEDMRPDKKPSNPELLSLLEAEYKKGGFRNKAIIRAICNSQTYQRTSKPLKENAQDRDLFSHQYVRQLTPDQMIDALSIAAGRKVYEGKNREQHTLLFATAEADADPTEFSHGIPQFLHQMNAGIAKDLKYVGGRFTKGRSKAEAIDAMYLTVLSRPVRPAELERTLAYLNKASDLQQAYSDVFWVLINTAEFTLNH